MGGRIPGFDELLEGGDDVVDYSDASRAPRLAAGDLPREIVRPAGDVGSTIGTAYPAGYVGGRRHGDLLDPRGELRAEAARRLVIHGEELEGRFALRFGEFVELAEDAT